MLSLCREYGFRLHIVHLSTSQALAELRAARAEGLPVSVETCPHYLHLSAETIADGATLSKCAPPIRSRENRERLWQGLRDGTIDMVVTDHSPCPPAMKRLDEGNFRTAWGGIASLSVALPLMWTEASRRGFTLLDLARWMAAGPARLAGCDTRKGRIAAGYDADFVVFDPDREFVVTEDKLHYRHPVSPYLGETLRGVVKATYLRGSSSSLRESFAASRRDGNTCEFKALIDPYNLFLFRSATLPRHCRSVCHTLSHPRMLASGMSRETKNEQTERIIGNSVPRKEGRDKVTGRSQYVDDMVLPNMLFGATVRSQIPRGRIRKITFGPGIAWDEFVVVSAKDIPGKNCIALIGDDQPCLASEFVNHPEEPILLLAHPDRHLLRKAVEAVAIEYDPLPAIFTIDESERRSQIIWGEDNVFKTYLIEKGDLDGVWEKADYIVEGEYSTGAQEQLYIENNGMIACL